MKKVIKIIVWCLVAAFVVFTFCFLWKQSRPAPVVYELVKPQQRDIVKRTVATGSLEPRTQVDLKPKVTGVIQGIRIKAGDMVKAGDVVAVINVIPDMSQLNQAQSQVEAARIALNELQRETARSNSLYEKGVISREEYERQQNALDTGRERLAAAQSQVEVIKTGSSRRAGGVNTTEVRAAMDGLVLSVPVKIGTSVSGSSAFSQGTTIATVADMNDIIFRGNIDETEVARLNVGMEVTLVPGAMQDVRIPATLDYISPEGILINGAKMFELKASAQVPEGINIRSGYSVNAEIQLAVEKDVLSVDESCVTFEDGKAFVYRLASGKDDVKHQQWERVPVELGLTDGVYVQVVSGVSENDVLRGIEK